MVYEVELKFPLQDVEFSPEQLLQQLETLQSKRGTLVEHYDTYFAHPKRNFGQTDEALRIRRVGERNWITYKGPLVDSQTKMRREIELPIGDGQTTAEQCTELLETLGFHPVRSVVKTRLPLKLIWEDRELELALDNVADLGRFFEIELLADESDCDAARDCVLRLSKRLGLKQSEQKSYLCLLLEQDAETAGS